MTYLRRDVKDLSNWTHLGGAMYIVRTQAGLRQALKHRFSDWKEYKVSGRPKKYPVLVIIDMGYCGYEFINLRTLHLNVLIEALVQQGEIPPCVTSPSTSSPSSQSLASLEAIAAPTVSPK